MRTHFTINPSRFELGVLRMYMYVWNIYIYILYFCIRSTTPRLIIWHQTHGFKSLTHLLQQLPFVHMSRILFEMISAASAVVFDFFTSSTCPVYACLRLASQWESSAVCRPAMLSQCKAKKREYLSKKRTTTVLPWQALANRVKWFRVDSSDKVLWCLEFSSLNFKDRIRWQNECLS